MALERVVPAYDGANTNDSPTTLAPSKAPVVDNFLVGRKGKLLMRGPINQFVQVLGTLDSHNVVGVWTYDDKLLIGTGTSGIGTRYPGSGGGAGGGEVHVVDLATLTAVVSTGGIPGGPNTRLGSYVWGRYAFTGFGSVRIGDVNGPLFPSYFIGRWDGTSGAAGMVTVNNGPTGFFDVKAFLNRLFVLGGRAADGTDTYIQPNTLFWSDNGGPTADTVANWQDDTTGLTNRLVIDTDDRNDTGMALARIGRSLAILKRKSVHLLTGTSPSNFSVRQVLSGTGCISQRSVVELVGACLFASEQGLILFDGASTENLSQDVQADFLGAALAAGSTTYCGRMPADHVLVTVLDPSRNVTFARVLHVPTRSWWSLSSGVMESTYPWFGGQSATVSWCYDGQGVFLLDKAFTPEAAALTERGFDQSGATKKRIPARWWSRLARLGLPTNGAAIKRLLMDYAFLINGGSDADDSWYVSLVTGDGRTLLPETRVPAEAGAGSVYAYRRQANIDVFAETAHDVQVRVEWKDDGSNTYPQIVRAELHDSHIEFQPAQERQST